MSEGESRSRKEHIWLSKNIGAEFARKRESLKIPGLPGIERIELACASFALAIGHSRAITLLVATGYDGSALALARSCVDAYSRGLWLMYCATAEEVQEVGKSKKNAFPKTDKMLAAIEERALPSGALGKIKNIVGNEWHSYTHGGSEQIRGQLSPDGLEQNYSPDSVHTVLMLADFWQLLSTAELAKAADNTSLHSDFLTLFDSYIDILALSWWGIEKFSEYAKL